MTFGYCFFLTLKICEKLANSQQIFHTFSLFEIRDSWLTFGRLKMDETV